MTGAATSCFIVVLAVYVASWHVQPAVAKQEEGLGPSSSDASSVAVDLTRAIGKTNPTFASWNIDSSYNRGFFHINFTNPNLRAAAKSLEPATLRFGGGGNDYLHYGVKVPCSSRNDSDSWGCLNDTHWDRLYDTFHGAGAEIVFGISFDKAAACQGKASYRWNATNAQQMVDYIVRTKQAIFGFELGNEVNNVNSPSHNCSISPLQQAAAFRQLFAMLEQAFPDASVRPKLIGPDSGYWNPKEWLQAFLPVVGTELHAVTHHVYPGVTNTSFNDPRRLDSVLGDIAWYVPLITAFAPRAEVWAGENGPHGGGEDGSCGVGSVCGTFATVFWYADSLGLRAKHGFVQHQRQDLVGGRYGLLAIDHEDESLGPDSPLRIQPDFWVNHLWKRTVGTTVLNATVQNSMNRTVRAYAFCGAPASPFAVNASGHVSLVLLNLNDGGSGGVSLSLGDFASYTSWALTPSSNGPFTQDALLNGRPLPRYIRDGKTIDRIPVPGKRADGNSALFLPPLSVTFVLAESSGPSPACK